MEDIQFESLIKVIEKGNRDINDNLEAIIVQKNKQNNEVDLQAIVLASQKTKKAINIMNKKIIEAVNNIKFPEQKETNLEETNKLLENLIKEQQKECKILVKLNLI